MRERPIGVALKALVNHVLLPPLTALQFLTLVPPLVRRAFTPQELGRAVGFFPLVGTLLGGLLWGLDHFISPSRPALLASSLLLAAWVTATGALHVDGFLDSLDGLFGGHTPDSRLEIMRDEAVGAFGLAGGVLLLMLKLTALTALPDRGPALVVAPTLARWGISINVFLFPYARARGLGRAMKDETRWPQAVVATASALAVSWFVAGPLGWMAFAAAALLCWAATRFVLSRIPGLTGDIYGALGEALELAILLLFVFTGP